MLASKPRESFVYVWHSVWYIISTLFLRVWALEPNCLILAQLLYLYVCDLGKVTQLLQDRKA